MRPILTPLIGAVLVLSAGRLPAQPQPETRDGRVTIHMTVHPAAGLKPVSRTYLLPEYKDSIPGNQVQMFLRCFMEQERFFGKEESERRDKWSTMPLAELPADEVKDYGGRLLGRDAADAARMQNVDWQLTTFLRRDGIGALVPDVQKMRSLAAALKARVRGQIRVGDHLGAIETLRTTFALARTMESHPTLIGSLVGLAITSIGCDAAEELVQQPGCPNLFWSFTDLPAPFLSLRPALQGERVMPGERFQPVAETPVTEAELARVIKEIDTFVETIGPDNKAPSALYAAWAADPKRVEAARVRLVETGVKPDAARAMSPLQAVVADDLQQFAVYRDELFKWMRLPLWETGGFKAVEEALVKAKAEPGVIVAAALLPAAIKVRQAQARLDQRIAYLRLIEAVRLSAHDNGGRLPASLAEFKLPLPLDPVTGQPFAYAVKDGVVTITGGNPSPGIDRTNRVYELRIEK
jgi:hypothetical protein